MLFKNFQNVADKILLYLLLLNNSLWTILFRVWLNYEL